MARGGRRGGAGRPKGSKDRHTRTKDADREYVRQRISARLGPLLDGLFALAEGFQFLAVREKSTGKFLRVAGPKEKLKPNEETIEVWQKSPQGTVTLSLLDRAIDKPAEPVQEHQVDGDLIIKWQK